MWSIDICPCSALLGNHKSCEAHSAKNNALNLIPFIIIILLTMEIEFSNTDTPQDFTGFAKDKNENYLFYPNFDEAEYIFYSNKLEIPEKFKKTLTYAWKTKDYDIYFLNKASFEYIKITRDKLFSNLQ